MEAAEYALLDRLESRMWWYRGLHRLMADALGRALAGVPPGPIIDAGCGTGGLLAALDRVAGQRSRIGLEIHFASAARAAAKARAPVVSASVNGMPFADGSAAAIVSADVLCHARVDPALALAEMARVLRPGGILLLNLPAYAWLRSAHDDRVHNARRFTAAGVRRLMNAAGLQLVSTSYWNSFLLPAMVLRRLLQRGGDGKSDVMEYPAPLDALFSAVLAFERRLIGAHVRLPAGGSLLAVARKNV